MYPYVCLCMLLMKDRSSFRKIYMIYDRFHDLSGKVMFLKKFCRHILDLGICRECPWHAFGMVFDSFYIFFELNLGENA